MAKFLGWDVEFKDETNDRTYTTEIVDLAIGEDNSSSIVMCTIKFSIDTSYIKYFLKPHDGTLTLTNKMVYTSDEENEMLMIKLQSVSNVGLALERDVDLKQGNITLLPVKYMCKFGTQLLNAKVGGVFYEKKVEDVVKELYQKALYSNDSNDNDREALPLNLEPFDNQSTYDYGIMVPHGKFSHAIRYLNQQYGFYDNMLLMFGDTFSSENFNWTISCINKIKREEVQLYLMQYDQNTKKDIKSIDERTYYTYLPVNILNQFKNIEVYGLPNVLEGIILDNKKFMQKFDISIPQTLKKINFLNTNEQFDNLLGNQTDMYTFNRMNQKDYTIKDSIQKIGLSAVKFTNLKIPNPFKISHFKIGTIINFITQSTGFINVDIKVLVLGWYLRLKQGNGISGGATWNSELQLRVCASSYLEDSSE